jgi:hypothetical protein
MKKPHDPIGNRTRDIFMRVASLIIPDLHFINISNIHSSEQDLLKSKIISNWFSASQNSSLEDLTT